jgi:hypothetical protein
MREIEVKNYLERGTIKCETVKWRVIKGNLDCAHPLCISPLFLIENVIVEYCILLARMGSALTKEEVMQLTNDLIKDTVHVKKLKAYKISRNLTYDEDNLVGEGWYHGFLKQNKDDIRTKCCKVQDCKQHTGVLTIMFPKCKMMFMSVCLEVVLPRNLMRK